MNSFDWTAVLSYCGLLAFLVDQPYGPAVDGREPAMAKDGMVATSQPLATEAGLDVLKAGGYAFDAAAVLVVVEPMMTGLGGDVFVLSYVAKTGELVGLNASGFSPKAVTSQLLRARGLDRVPQTGAFSVTVPGAVDGWATRLDTQGSMSLAEVLAPAIRHAEEGFAVTEIIAGDDEFNRVFLQGTGTAP